MGKGRMLQIMLCIMLHVLDQFAIFPTYFYGDLLLGDLLFKGRSILVSFQWEADLSNAQGSRLHFEICEVHLRSHPLFLFWINADPNTTQSLCNKAIGFIFLRAQDYK